MPHPARPPAVGPLGMAAQGLIHLGRAASHAGVVPDLAATLATGAPWVALVLWGAAAWWFTVALASVGSRARELPFNVGW